MNRAAKALAVVAGIFALSLCAAAQTGHVAQAPKAKAGHDAAVEAMFGVRGFLQAEISPDGKRVAWAEALPGAGGAPSSNSAIYVADVSAPGARKRITAGDGKAAHEEHDLAWSGDSKRIAFLSDAPKAGQLQLFVADAAGGAAKQLTHLIGFLAGPGWSPDAKTIAVLFTENATRAAGPLVAETPDEGVVSEEFLEQRLTLVDAATGKVRQISPKDWYVYEFDWAPDGKQLAITAAQGNGDNNWYVAGLFAIEAASGTIHDVQPKPGMQIAGPKWSPDGKQIIYIGGLMSDEPIPGGDVYSTPVEGGAAKNLTPESKSTATQLTWGNAGAIFITGIADGQVFVSRLDADHTATLVWKGAETLARGEFVPYVSFADDGKTTAVVKESFAKPPEVWAGPVGDWKQITNVNAGVKPAWGEAKSLQWTTDIGAVQGWLIYPQDYDPAKKYPMVVYVHGGPAWAITPTVSDAVAISVWAAGARIFCTGAESARELRAGRKVHAGEREGFRIRRFPRHHGGGGRSDQTGARGSGAAGDYGLELRRVHDDVGGDADEPVWGGGGRGRTFELHELLRGEQNRPVDDSVLWRNRV